jgi:hypothetical protein
VRKSLSGSSFSLWGTNSSQFAPLSVRLNFRASLPARILHQETLGFMQTYVATARS